MVTRPDETWHRLLEWTYDQAPSERLAAQILLDQGFTDFDPSHPLGGKDGGKDGLARKDGQVWLMAVYFPRGQQSMGTIQTKFAGDLAGVAKNQVVGMAFVTNQELTLSERAQLKALCGQVLLEIFHLERIATLLDQPHMAPVRQQFLYIDSPSTPPPQGFILPAGWASLQQGDIINGCVRVGSHSIAVQQQIKTQADGSIESCLTWQSRIPQALFGRDAEMADLMAWATGGDAAPRLRLLHGMGGMGKTRLAVELGDRLRSQGWGVCLVGSFVQDHAFEKGQAGTLLIIDYPELYPDALAKLLAWLGSGHLPPGHWRILLLSRDERLAQSIDQLFPGRRDASLMLNNLPDDEHAWQLFAAASEQMRAANAGTPEGRNAALLTQARFAAWQAQDAHHRDPLIILAYALNLQYDPAAILLGHVGIMHSLVAHEERRIVKGLPSFSRDQQRTLLLLKALAALTGGLQRADIKALRSANLPADGLAWPSMPDVQESTLWKSEQIAEIQPDRLAAYFLHAVVEQTIPDDKAAWLWCCLLLGDADNDLLRARFGRLGRLAWDYAWQNSTGFGLAEAITPDADKAARLEPVFDNNRALEVPLQKLVLEVNRLRLAFWEAEAEKDFAAAAPALAGRLNNFSVRLAAMGQREAALAAIARAVTIHEELARQNIAGYGPNLASSLNNWSNHLAEAGQRDAALAAIEGAVTIREELARQNFAAYGPVLARSLNNWSNRLAAAGQREAALAAIERAVTIYEELARQNFATYGPDLAMSLNNWSNRLAEACQQEEALAAIERAVTIYDELARQNFAAYGSALAASLNNWSVNLAAAGQHDAAVAAIERAVTIREELARQNFAAYGPDLASSLNNWSVRLAAAGQREAALAAIERAITIREELARQTPAVVEPVLAGSLAILAGLLPAPEAIPHLQRALRLITPYAIPGTTYEQWQQWIQEALQAHQATISSIPTTTPT